MKSFLKKIIPKTLRDYIYFLRIRGFKRQALYTYLSLIQRFHFKVDSVVKVSLRGETISFPLSQKANVAQRFVKNGQSIAELISFSKLCERKSCLLDVGAAQGIFSVVFASFSKSGSALAVEPAESMISQLDETFELHGGQRLRAVGVALGKLKGTSSFTAYGDGQIRMSKATADNRPEIETDTMDAFLEASGFSPDLVKIDVEGFELDVVEGGVRFLTECSPTLFMEIHPDILKSEGIALLELKLRSLDYEIYDLNGNIVSDLKRFCSTLRDSPNVGHVICEK
ncbi:MAG: FkbM family methyltransferase [Opitutales bacterium]